MKKGLITIVLTSSIFLSFSYPVYAQSASPSASLQEKLKQLQTEIASRAAQIKQDINKQLQNRAYIGFIKSKSDTSLTLATQAGSKVVNINQYTDFSGDTKATQKNLAENDYVAALGDVDDTEVLTAKKVIRYPAPVNSDRQIVGGTVTNITGATITLKEYAGTSITLNTDNKTEFVLKDNDTTLSALKNDRQILVVMLPPTDKQKSSNFYARFIYIIPYTNDASTPPSASPSATPSPSASPNKK